MERLEVESLGPIKQADVEFGDLTVLVRPRASGRNRMIRTLAVLVGCLLAGRAAQAQESEIETEPQKARSLSGATSTAALATTAVSTHLPAPAPKPGRGLRYVGVGVGILGTAALASGVVFGLLVQQTQREVENQSKHGVVDSSAISGKLADGYRYETLQWVCYGVGAAAAIAGSLLYWMGTDSDEPRPSAARVSPMFMTKGAGASLQMAF
jgi:hypothetical protein